MAGVGARTFTLQLNSATAEKPTAGAEQYRLALTPPIEVPYLARPRVRLEQFCFTNAATNLDVALYGNTSITFQWNPFITHHPPNPNTGPAYPALTRHPKTKTIVIPDGHYSLASLEETVARMLYRDPGFPADPGFPPLHITADSGLFFDMDILSSAEPAPSAAGETFTVAGTAGDAQTGHILELTTIPHQRYLGGSFAGNGARITAISTEMFAGVQAGTKCIVLLTKAMVAGDGVVGAGTAKLVQPGALDTEALPDAADFLAYGSDGLAHPSLNPDSGWGTAISFDECVMIAHTPAGAVPDANTIAKDYAHASTGAVATAQNKRKIWPVIFQPDPVTNKLQVICASPLVRVDSTSTLFTKSLGFTAAQFASAPQSMLANRDTTKRAPWTASGAANLLRTRAIEFHCPTLASSAYNQDGKLMGAQLASVPIQVPQNATQAWQCHFDNSIPCSGHHGASIDSVSWYLSNERGEDLNLQGEQFQATVRVYWPDPIPPPLGSAGAEEGVYGLRDVKYV